MSSSKKKVRSVLNNSNARSLFLGSPIDGCRMARNIPDAIASNWKARIKAPYNDDSILPSDTSVRSMSHLNKIPAAIRTMPK
jgi:hypothetical protein